MKNENKLTGRIKDQLRSLMAAWSVCWCYPSAATNMIKKSDQRKAVVKGRWSGRVYIYSDAYRLSREAVVDEEGLGSSPASPGSLVTLSAVKNCFPHAQRNKFLSTNSRPHVTRQACTYDDAEGSQPDLDLPAGALT